MRSTWARHRLSRWCGGRMPVQAAQWTEFLSCPICYNEFDSSGHQPISLGCSHTVCKTCLHKLHRKACPFDQTPISTDIDLLPVNCALLQLVGAQVRQKRENSCLCERLWHCHSEKSLKLYVFIYLLCSSLVWYQVPDVQPVSLSSAAEVKHYEVCRMCVEELALYLKPISGSKGTVCVLCMVHLGSCEKELSSLYSVRGDCSWAACVTWHWWFSHFSWCWKLVCFYKAEGTFISLRTI